MREFKIGFTGSVLAQSIDWVKSTSMPAERICIPFAGSCKTIAALAKETTVIESWDLQIVSRAIIEGVFTQDKIESNIDKPRYKKGHMYETLGLENIDERCAGFIDYVGAHGTLADKVAMFSAAVRSTTMGRMTDWSTKVGITELWYKFLKQRDYLTNFTDLPGTFNHHEASVFEVVPEGPYDLMFVDPPKIVSKSDIYSASFQNLNLALGGKETIARWTWRDTVGYLRKIFELDTKEIAFIYVSDVHPSMDVVRKVLSEYATIVDETRFLHRSRYDYITLARKEG